MAIYAEVAKQPRKPNSSTALKKSSLSLLDTNIAAIAKFDSIFRGHLLEIKARLSFLNEIIDDIRYYDKLSFQTGISPENHAIANTNLNFTLNRNSAQKRNKRSSSPSIFSAGD